MHGIFSCLFLFFYQSSVLVIEIMIGDMSKRKKCVCVCACMYASNVVLCASILCSYFVLNHLFMLFFIVTYTTIVMFTMMMDINMFVHEVDYCV